MALYIPIPSGYFEGIGTCDFAPFNGLPYALMGWALMALPGPSWAGP